MARPNLQIRSLSPTVPKPGGGKEPSPNQLRPRTPRSSRSAYSSASLISRKLLHIKAKIGRISAAAGSTGTYAQEHSNLTEVSLEEHNRIQAAVAVAEIIGRRHWGTSPYYKGLTDSGLYLNRLRNGGGPSSPGRESRASARTASSSISTVFTRIHEWGSTCFKGKPAASNSGSPSAASGGGGGARTSSNPVPPTTSPAAAALVPPPPPLPPPPLPPPPPPRVSVSAIQDVIEIGSMRAGSQFVRPVGRGNPIDGKPLRERVVMFPLNMDGDQLGDHPEMIIGKQQRPVLVPEETAAICKEKEFVWADRYRPITLNDFICNRHRATYLRDIVAQAKCSHLIFEGPPGVGKRTMIWALLKEIYGPESLTTKDEWKEFLLKGEAMANIKVRMKVSAHHVEINLSELRGYERQVIVDLVKQTDNSADEVDEDCTRRAIVLHESDKLSTDAQHYIRWVMERYKSSNKIIFCCSDVSKLHPVRSLCEHIQLLPPSNSEIVEVLEFIAKQEGIDLPHPLAEKIADNSKQNLRQAIRSFEASWQLMNFDFIQNERILTGWEDDIANIAKNIIDEQSPKQLYIIRGKLQKLIEHSVSPEFIFSTLVEELKKHLDEKFKPRIDALYLEYNRDGGFPSDGANSVVLIRRPEEAPGRRNSDPVKKNIYHFMKIEEFTAKFMSFYKSCVKKNSEGSDGETLYRA